MNIRLDTPPPRNGDGAIEHEAVLVSQIALAILTIWQDGLVLTPGYLAEQLAANPNLLRSGLRAHHVHDLWPMALTAAKFTARVAGLPIPKGAHQ